MLLADADESHLQKAESIFLTTWKTCGQTEQIENEAERKRLRIKNENQSHQLNRWLTKALEGYVTVSPLPNKRTGIIVTSCTLAPVTFLPCAHPKIVLVPSVQCCTKNTFQSTI